MVIMKIILSKLNFKLERNIFSAVLLLPSYYTQSQQSSHFSDNAQNVRCVGKFSDPKANGIYETGQIFLHRVFGYRGVILFPWMGHVFDRDVINHKKNKPEDPPSEDLMNYHAGKEVKGKLNTFYQVLMDIRDCPHIRAQTEAVTFLGTQDNERTLYAVPGLDYVAHEDIMPYTAVDKTPIKHDLFQKFLGRSKYSTDDPPFYAKDALKSWEKRNSCWLELSDVHVETTKNIRVTVIPFYMGCRLSENNHVYWWRYCIRLENLGEGIVQLRERHFRIFSLSGTLETVRGRGVVGEEPILSQEHPAFQYSSHVSLQAPSGHMWGTFKMEREDGYTFDCRVPPFSLESKHEEEPEDFI